MGTQSDLLIPNSPTSTIGTKTTDITIPTKNGSAIGAFNDIVFVDFIAAHFAKHNDVFVKAQALAVVLPPIQ